MFNSKIFKVKLYLTIPIICLIIISCSDDPGVIMEEEENPKTELFSSKISGKVLNNVYEGLANSTVELYKDGVKLASTSTDAEGQFTIDKDLELGEYKVFAQLEEYVDKMISLHISEMVNVSVDIPLANGGEKIKGDDPINENLAKVTGRFVNPDGNRALGWVFFRDEDDSSLLSDVLVRTDRSGYFEAYLEYGKPYLLTMSENCEEEETYISDQPFPAIAEGSEYTFEDYESVHYYNELHRLVGTFKNCGGEHIESGLLLLELEEEVLQEIRMPIANGSVYFDDVFQCNSTFEDGQTYRVYTRDMSDGGLGFYSETVEVVFENNTLDLNVPNACAVIEPSLSYVKNEEQEVTTIEGLKAKVSENILTLYSDGVMEFYININTSTNKVIEWYAEGAEGLISDRDNAPIEVNPEVRLITFSINMGARIEGTLDFYYLANNSNTTNRIRADFKTYLGN